MLLPAPLFFLALKPILPSEQSILARARRQSILVSSPKASVNTVWALNTRSQRISLLVHVEFIATCATLLKTAPSMTVTRTSSSTRVVTSQALPREQLAKAPPARRGVSAARNVFTGLLSSPLPSDL